MTGAGFPHSDIHGSKLGRQLTVAFRSHPRPSSVLDAKASTVGPLYLGRTKMLVLAMQFSRNDTVPASRAGTIIEVTHTPAMCRAAEPSKQNRG